MSRKFHTMLHYVHKFIVFYKPQYWMYYFFKTFTCLGDVLYIYIFLYLRCSLDLMKNFCPDGRLPISGSVQLCHFGDFMMSFRDPFCSELVRMERGGAFHFAATTKCTFPVQNLSFFGKWKRGAYSAEAHSLKSFAIFHVMTFFKLFFICYLLQLLFRNISW